jgi:calcium-dependent protein kinase
MVFMQDKSGFITPEEVKCILGFGKQISESAWTDIVKQVDANGDGKISYEEFKEMMMKFME